MVEQREAQNKGHPPRVDLRFSDLLLYVDAERKYLQKVQNDLATVFNNLKVEEELLRTKLAQEQKKDLSEYVKQANQDEEKQSSENSLQQDDELQSFVG